MAHVEKGEFRKADPVAKRKEMKMEEEKQGKKDYRMSASHLYISAEAFTVY